MKMRDCLIPAIVTIVACVIGFTLCADPVSPNCPTDNSGVTSIVVHIGGEGWCELRGPARWKVFDDFSRKPVVRRVPPKPKKSDIEGFIVNPYCTDSKG